MPSLLVDLLTSLPGGVSKHCWSLSSSSKHALYTHTNSDCSTYGQSSVREGRSRMSCGRRSGTAAANLLVAFLEPKQTHEDVAALRLIAHNRRLAAPMDCRKDCAALP